MAQENRNAYIAWLRGKLGEHCNEDGAYEVFWDYDDSITPDQLAAAVDNWKSEGYTSPTAYLEATMYDAGGLDYEAYLLDYIEDDLPHAPQAVLDYHLNERDGLLTWDDLYEAGYAGLDMNLDCLLSGSSFNVNVFFATEAERNFDMGSIVNAFGNDYRDPSLEDVDAEDLDNALSYLVNQQGHSVAEVYGNVDNAFIRSVREEIDENSSEAMSCRKITRPWASSTSGPVAAACSTSSLRRTRCCRSPWCVVSKSRAKPTLTDTRSTRPMASSGRRGCPSITAWALRPT